ncbi:MAG: PepSY domain-containing protein [Chthoniobacterales bacterium]
MPFPTRKLHRRLSPVLFSLLAVSAITGIAYRAGKKWFGMDGQTGQAVMEWHTGEWLGPHLAPFYVLITGAGLVFLLVTGLLMSRQRGGKGASRWWHRALGVALALPLALTAVTGVAYELGQSWFGISEETADFLMTIHEGAWLGKNLKVYYVVVTGSGLLALGMFGLALLGRRRSRPS